MSNTLTITTADVEVVTLASFLEAEVASLEVAAALAEITFLDEELNDDKSVESFDRATILGWDALQLNSQLADARLVLAFEA